MGWNARRRLATLVPLVAMLAAGCTSKAPDPLGSIRFALVSGPMPSISGPTVQGGSVSPLDYSGKVVLVSFWASWCGPCRQEQPGLEALWKQLGPGGRVQFIGVDYNDQPAPGRKFLNELGLTYPSVSDPTGTLGGRFGVAFMPSTFLVDGRGQLRYRLTGAVETTPANLRSLIATLLSG